MTKREGGHGETHGSGSTELRLPTENTPPSEWQQSRQQLVMGEGKTRWQGMRG